MTGFGMCGSFCTHSSALKVLRELSSKDEIIPIMSQSVYTADTRFGSAKTLIESVSGITGREVIHTVKDAEPLGPKIQLDILIICPCTGNTLAKIAHGITDTPVTMAAKAHLRCARPLLITLASNDAMGANFENIALLANRKNVYFTPMVQDDPIGKPNSLVADFSLVAEAAVSARNGRQMRPLFLECNL